MIYLRFGCYPLKGSKQIWWNLKSGQSRRPEFRQKKRKKRGKSLQSEGLEKVASCYTIRTAINIANRHLYALHWKDQHGLAKLDKPVSIRRWGVFMTLAKVADGIRFHRICGPTVSDSGNTELPDNK